MKYKVIAANPNRHLLEIEIHVSEHQGDTLNLQLPSWRPGRYETGNFAKNIKTFAALDLAGNSFPFIKTGKDLWQVQTSGARDILIRYSYFAFELNAGSSFFNENLLYINPVNCFMYVPGRENESCETEFVALPEAYEIASQMEQKGRVLSAPNFDYLADSPVMAGKGFTHFHFDLSGSEVHLWFNGKFSADFGEILEHTYAYCSKQVEIFGEFPCKKYHFLYHILPYRFHHGVEHLDSTVIALGPADQFSELDLYREFLSVSSHEFYHLWNVKRIRPAEMLPYDLTKENYSRQGYVYEGVTTYMGDLMLMRAGVFEWEEYAESFSKILQRHFDNYGRYNMSVAASSWDSWLDGYVPGVFGRKVSIYVEGALAAFILDTILRREAPDKDGMDELMRRLYFDFYKKGKGYSQADYLGLINTISGSNHETYVNEILEGCGHIEKYLPQALDHIGCSMQKTDSDVYYEREWGLKASMENGSWIVKMVAPDSPADACGLSENDVLHRINDKDMDNMLMLSDWLHNLNQREHKIEVISSHKNKTLTLTHDRIGYWHRYGIQKLSTATEAQKTAFKAWSGYDF